MCPEFATQVFTIRCNIGDSAVTCVFSILSSKNFKCYQRVARWTHNKVVEMLKGERPAIKRGFADFEEPLRRDLGAVRSIGETLRGDWEEEGSIWKTLRRNWGVLGIHLRVLGDTGEYWGDTGKYWGNT